MPSSPSYIKGEFYRLRHFLREVAKLIVLRSCGAFVEQEGVRGGGYSAPCARVPSHGYVALTFQESLRGGWRSVFKLIQSFQRVRRARALRNIYEKKKYETMNGP